MAYNSNKPLTEEELEARGRAAYEEDCRRCPYYVDYNGLGRGPKRAAWDDLLAEQRHLWRNNPTPGNYYDD